MLVRVERITIDPKTRIIVISDVHGSFTLLDKLLKKVSFRAEDQLFLLGDFLEKGKNSLETLRYVMKLAKQTNVHVLMGNCENIYVDCGNERPFMRIPYFIRNIETLGRELFKIHEKEITPSTHVKEFYDILETHYPEELQFLKSLPHIIETPLYTFVHGGIDPTIKLEEHQDIKVMKWDNFRLEGYTFSKFLVCGHWPTINYCHGIPSCNPIIDYTHKIISIDGGYGIKNFGQINAFIIEKESDFSYQLVDELEYVRVYEDQIPVKQKPFTIAYPEGEIEILESGEEFDSCLHVASGTKMKVLKSLIYEMSNKKYCSDATNYLLTSYRGDWVGIIKRTSKYTLAKRSGTIGWINNNKIVGEFIK